MGRSAPAPAARSGAPALGREAAAGLTTFLTMAYILFVNPLILGGLADRDGVRLDPRAVMSSTALVAGVLSLVMGLVARVPLAMAAGMGLNAVVAFHLVGDLRLSWPEAMGVVVAEGLVVAGLVVAGVREAVMDAVPLALKRAIGVGIGLFLAALGLLGGGVISRAGGGPIPVQLGRDGRLHGWPLAVFAVGLLLCGALTARRVRGALLLGVLGATALALGINAATGGTAWPAPAARLPADWLGAPDLSLLGRFSFGFAGRLGATAAALTVLALLLSDFFDTMGTVFAVGTQAGFVDERGRVSRAGRILLVDALGAIAGGAASSSSATTYVESAAGVAAGGRTGVTAAVVGLCFLASLALAPLAPVIPPEATAPALLVVGYLMTREIGTLPWDDPVEAIPAFLTVVGIPFTFRITAGIGVGFIAHVALALAAGRGRRLHPLLVLATAGFVVYFAVGG